MDNKDLVAIFAQENGSGGGGDVTPAAVLAAVKNMTTSQAKEALEELGVFVVTVDTTSSPYTADKTFSEVSAAISAGNVAVYIGVVSGDNFQAATVQHSNNIIQAYGIVRGASGASLVTLYHTAFALTISTVALQEAPITTTVTGSTPTIALCENNHIYECGELSSLTVTAIDNPGWFSIHFLSGATPTLCVFPAGMKFPTSDGQFAGCEANTEVEINVFNGRALVADSWPYTPPAAEE